MNANLFFFFFVYLLFITIITYIIDNLHYFFISVYA